MVDIAALSELEAEAFRYTRNNICLPCVCDILFDMAGVSKRGQKNIIKLLPAAQLQSPTLGITSKQPKQLC